MARCSENTTSRTQVARCARAQGNAPEPQMPHMVTTLISTARWGGRRTGQASVPSAFTNGTQQGEYNSGEYRGAVARALPALSLQSKVDMSAPPARPSSVLQRHGFRLDWPLNCTLGRLAHATVSPAPAPGPRT